jgi:hypothetical protein
MATLVERSCVLARRMADLLNEQPRIHILNVVVLNQVLVQCDAPDGSDPGVNTAEVIRRVQGMAHGGLVKRHGMERT